MKRIWGYVIAVLAAGTTVGAVMPACATNDQTIFVHGALAPSTNRQNNTCTYTNDPQQAQLFMAKLDLGLVDSYFSILLVGNQTIPRGDQLSNRAESNRVHINGAIVRVTEPDGTLIREFTSLATGFADPSNNNAPSYATIGVIAFDAPTKTIILNSDGMHPEQPGLPNRAAVKTLLINIKAFGKTLGGEDVESDFFQLPMEVCKGCLVNTTDANDPLQKPNPNCLKALPVGSTVVAPCFFGQDEGVPCQSCVGTIPVCDPSTP
jgi:hypothetical protein